MSLNSITLPVLSILKKRYVIEKILGKGGFGVTYIAKDLNYNRNCVIKEYLPSEYSTRSGATKNITPFTDAKAQYVFNHGREKFVEEARTLITLRNNPIVVDIWDFFQENNTVYVVMELLEAQNIRKVKRDGKIDIEFLKAAFMIITSSLNEVHKLHIRHCGLCPEHIVITNDGRIKVLGSWVGQGMNKNFLFIPGYSAPEIYARKGEVGSHTDIYALCASFYELFSGRKPADALCRYRGQKQPTLVEMGCQVTKQISDVIEKGMALNYKDRYQNCRQMLNDIDERRNFNCQIWER